MVLIGSNNVNILLFKWGDIWLSGLLQYPVGKGQADPSCSICSGTFVGLELRFPSQWESSGSQWRHSMAFLSVSLVSTSQILDEIAEQGIKIYQLPDADSDEDEEFKEQTRVLKVREGHSANAGCYHRRSAISLCWFSDTPFSSHSSLLPFTGTAPHWYLYFPHILSSAFGCPLTFDFLSQASIPFAVIGSNQLIEVKGKKIRGRLYPWGVVEVENPEHNDFLKLRTMLVWVSLVIIWKVKSNQNFCPVKLVAARDEVKIWALLPSSVWRCDWCLSVAGPTCKTSKR